MDNEKHGYLSISRKFRPKAFFEVLGQEAIVTSLKNSLQAKRLVHAYLFSGPRGSGKTTLARIFAKALNCQSPLPDGESCNRCSACREIDAGSSLDVVEIDGASNRSVDDVRKINENVLTSTSFGHYRIYIIDEVHMLTKEAYNALLKTLEEPPTKVKFIFATTEPHKIPLTVLSRVQRYHLQRLRPEQIVQKLKSISDALKIAIDHEALALIAEKAEGAFRDAEMLLDQAFTVNASPIRLSDIESLLGLPPRQIYERLYQHLCDRARILLIEEAKKLYYQGFDLVLTLEGFTRFLRDRMFDLMKAKSPDRLKERALLRSLEVAVSLLQESRTHPLTLLSFELFLSKLVSLQEELPLEELVLRLEMLEKSLPFPEEELPKATNEPPPLKPAPKEEAVIVHAPSVETEKITAPALSQSKIDTLLQFSAIELDATLDIAR